MRIHTEKEVPLYKFTNIDVRSIVKEIKEALDDHLIAVNENTNEIESNHEFLLTISEKIDKMSERLEKIELFLNNKANFKLEEKQDFKVKMLSNREKEVFMMLYSLSESIGTTTYIDIAKRIGLTENLVSA